MQTYCSNTGVWFSLIIPSYSPLCHNASSHLTLFTIQYHLDCHHFSLITQHGLIQSEVSPGLTQGFVPSEASEGLTISFGWDWIYTFLSGMVSVVTACVAWAELHWAGHCSLQLHSTITTWHHSLRHQHWATKTPMSHHHYTFTQSFNFKV